jgi:hypothetical protein
MNQLCGTITFVIFCASLFMNVSATDFQCRINHPSVETEPSYHQSNLKTQKQRRREATVFERQPHTSSKSEATTDLKNDEKSTTEETEK